MNELQAVKNDIMSFEQVEKLAKAMSASRLFPSAQTPENALALMLLCQSEGIHPAQAVRRFHVIKGTVAMRADAMLAEFQARGGRVQWLKSDKNEARAVFEHACGGKFEYAYTIEDAEQAGLVRPDSGWSKFPAAMLRARCISCAIRMVLPGVVCGVYTPEEVMDFDADKQPQPQPVKRQKAEPKSEPTQQAEEAQIVPQAEPPKATKVHTVELPAEPAKPAEPKKTADATTGAHMASLRKAARDAAIKAGIRDREECFGVASAAIGRNVTDWSDLSADELRKARAQFDSITAMEQKEAA
jgi:hypothetical protein